MRTETTTTKTSTKWDGTTTETTQTVAVYTGTVATLAPLDGFPSHRTVTLTDGSIFLAQVDALSAPVGYVLSAIIGRDVVAECTVNPSREGFARVALA